MRQDVGVREPFVERFEVGKQRLDKLFQLDGGLVDRGAFFVVPPGVIDDEVDVVLSERAGSVACPEAG